MERLPPPLAWGGDARLLFYRFVCIDLLLCFGTILILFLVSDQQSRRDVSVRTDGAGRQTWAACMAAALARRAQVRSFELARCLLKILIHLQVFHFSGLLGKPSYQLPVWVARPCTGQGILLLCRTAPWRLHLLCTLSASPTAGEVSGCFMDQLSGHTLPASPPEPALGEPIYAGSWRGPSPAAFFLSQHMGAFNPVGLRICAVLL